MMQDKRLDLIRVLLAHAIKSNRHSDNFMRMLQDNKQLFHIDISPIIDNPYFEIADTLGIKHKKASQLYDFLNSKSMPIDELVEKFLTKYNI